MAEPGPEAGWTSTQVGALKEFAVRSRPVARRPRVDAAAVQTLDAFAGAGVDALLLKGPVLAQALYRADEARGYHDIDLLVPAKDLPAAGLALAELGYRNISESRGIDDVAGILHAEVFSALVDGLGHLQIDLHWRLDGCEASPELVWSLLNARRAYIELDGRQVPTLDQVGLALHLALHAAQHGTADLKTIGDLKRGLDRWPRETWRQAAELAAGLAATDAFAAGLALVPAGAALARELGLPTADLVLWEIARRGTRPRGTFHLDAFARAGTQRERIDVLRRSLFPRRAWIAWEYKWARVHPALTPAAYLLHVARAPAWALRAAKYRRSARRMT